MSDVKKNKHVVIEARPKSKEEILAEAFRPGVVGASGGRPAYSILQLYRCFTLSHSYIDGSVLLHVIVYITILRYDTYYQCFDW